MLDKIRTSLWLSGIVLPAVALTFFKAMSAMTRRASVVSEEEAEAMSWSKTPRPATKLSALSSSRRMMGRAPPLMVFRLKMGSTQRWCQLGLFLASSDFIKDSYRSPARLSLVGSVLNMCRIVLLKL